MVLGNLLYWKMIARHEQPDARWRQIILKRSKVNPIGLSCHKITGLASNDSIRNEMLAVSTRYPARKEMRK